jgi:hypothetical protein
MHIFTKAAAALAAVLTVASTTNLAAQKVASQTAKVARASDVAPSRALLLRVNDLGNPTARAVVIRRPAGAFTQDIILVSDATSASDLAKAVAALMFSRRTRGSKLKGEIRANVIAEPSRNARRTHDEQLAAQDLARLGSARVVDVDGIGRGPGVAITPAPVQPRVR